MQTQKQLFTELAMPLADSLFRTGMRLLGNEKSAEDLVQEAMMKAYKNFHQFQKGTNFKAWIFTILMNSFRNQYRKTKKEPAVIDIATVSMFYASHSEDMFTPVPADDINFDNLVSDEVKNALTDLPLEYREVVILSMLQDFSYQDIAKMLEIPMGTVMSRLYRGRQLLKQRLTEYARSMGYIKRTTLS